MRTTTILRLSLVTLLAAPLALAAQRPMRGPGRAMGDGPRELPSAGVTQILNARRVLDLTSRQVTQLDSIERSLFAERRAAGTRMQAFRDSIRRQMEANPPATDADREARRAQVRQRVEAMQPQMQQLRTRDSTARAAALRVLTDAQRQQLREIQAEQRGRMQGRREAEMRGGRGGERRMIRPEMGGGERRMIRPGVREGAPGMEERRMIERDAAGRRPAPAPRPDDEV